MGIENLDFCYYKKEKVWGKLYFEFFEIKITKTNLSLTYIVNHYTNGVNKWFKGLSIKVGYKRKLIFEQILGNPKNKPESSKMSRIYELNYNDSREKCNGQNRTIIQKDYSVSLSERINGWNE